MRGATALTPLDSVVEIGKELKKEEPDYKKIGLLTAMEAAGAVAPMAKPVLTAVKSSKAAQPFKKTRKAYRIATQAEDGKLYPLFVNADDEIPVGQWISASIPPITFKGKNGNMYVPSKGAKRSKGEKAKPTGDMQVLPDQETADKLREAGFSVEKPSKAAPFGKVRAVASRPGYHATTKPVAHHLGPEDLIINEAEKNKLIKAGITPKAFKEKTFNYLDGKLISKKKIADLSEEEKKRVTKQKKFYVKRRAEDQVFLEVDMADDTSEELLSYMNARGRTDINDKLPEGGSYTYQDGQADAETWVVGGDMKVNRVLDRDEALTIQKKMGVKDLPLRSEVEDILERNFSNGGLVEEGIDMYQGQDDSLLVEGIGMAKGGLPEQMAMNFGDVPDNTIGVDPVSGNEIPMGSTAENVRDDIPANLSEGEIVMAADVVNFHGVKLFEDLRAEAKMGYAKMANDGRIGGEPMEEDMSDIGIEITLEDLKLQDTEQREEAFLGKFFDEGGLATDEELSIMPIDIEPTPVETKKPTRKIYERKGGFDMDAIANKPRVQIYEYVNAEGHRIFITYIDNVPQSQIPPGYVLSGEPTDINSIYYDPENPDPTEPTDPEDPDPTEPTDPEVPPEEGGTTTTSGGGGGGSSGSGNTNTPEPFNYKELTMEELEDLVDEMSSFGTKLAGLNPITKIAVKLSHNQTRKEIERRLTDPNVSEVDKMRYRNLLELSNRKQPNLIATVGDFISGNTTQRIVDQIPKPKIPDVDYSDPTLAPTPYTPDVQTSNKLTTPGVDEEMPSGYSNEIKTQIQQASADAASAAFGSPSKTVKPVGNDDFIEDVKKDPDSFLPPTSTNDNDDSPIFRPPTPAPKPSPIYDNVAAGDYNDDSTGVYKGGMMRKKKKKKSK